MCPYFNSSFTPLLDFKQPPTQMDLSFKLRMLHMKTKQAKQQVPAGGYIGWSVCRELRVVTFQMNFHVQVVAQFTKSV